MENSSKEKQGDSKKIKSNTKEKRIILPPYIIEEKKQQTSHGLKPHSLAVDDGKPGFFDNPNLGEKLTQCFNSRHVSVLTHPSPRICKFEILSNSKKRSEIWILNFSEEDC